MALGYRFSRNFAKVRTGTSWRAHLVMAVKLLAISPDVKGHIVEYGCWKGGSTTNLSLLAAINGRKLRVYDSFEDLPPPADGDPIAARSFKGGFIPGVFGGSLDEVTGNVENTARSNPANFSKAGMRTPCRITRALL